MNQALEASGAVSPAAGRSRPTLPLVISIEGGQGSLVLEGLSLSVLGRIDHLSMNVPDLRFPFDLSGGAGRFRHRRCVLSEATLSLGAEDIVQLLQNAALAAHGLDRPIVELGPDGFVLGARVRVGGHAAELTASGYVRVVGGDTLRLACYDLRLHGFVPLAAPQVVTALLRAVCGAAFASPTSAGQRPTVNLQGPTEIVFDPLAMALFDVFPARGWRIPSRRELSLLPVGHAGERLLLKYRPAKSVKDDELEEFAFGGSGTRSGGRSAYEEGRSLFADAEAVLASGDVRAALTLYRRAATLHSNNTFVATRLLQLLSASRSTLSEAEELASAQLARNPGFGPALLARAVAAAERGQSLQAAELYERLAKASEPLPSMEAAAALTAAAEMYLKASQVDRAMGLLESVRATRPAHPRALDVLRQLYGEQKRWADWLNLLRRRELEEPDPTTRAKLLMDAGQVLLQQMQQPARAAERFAESVVLDETLADAWFGLGQSRKALEKFDAGRNAFERAVLCFSQQGDYMQEAQALAALAECEEAAGVDAAAEAHWSRAIERSPQSVPWLQRRARALARLGRGEEAAALLLTASLACRSQQGASNDPSARFDLEVERAGLLGRVLGDRARGRTALEDVLRASPAHLGALDELAAQAQTDDLPDVLVFFERALERIVDPSGFAAVLGRARDVAARAGDEGFVARALAASAATGTAAGARAAVAWAQDVLKAPRVESEPTLAVPEPLLVALDRYRQSPPGQLEDLHAEVAYMQGLLHEAQGHATEAEQDYRAGLERNPSAGLLLMLAQNLSALVLQQNQTQAAAEILFDAALCLPPGELPAAALADLVIRSAQLFDQAADKDAATKAWKLAAQADPQRPEPWRALESLYEQAGDTTALIETLAQHAAATKLIERRDAYARLGGLLSQEPERLHEADEAYGNALEVDGEHVLALLWLASRAWDAGRFDESAALSRRLIEVALRPHAQSPLTSAQLADAYLRLSRWDRLAGSLSDAEKHLELALVQEPNGAQLPLLVDVLESAGESEALVKALQKRVDNLDPQAANHREVESELAAALERAGRSEEALAVYRRRLATTADDTETLRRLVELCRRESRFDELLETLERLLSLVTGADSKVSTDQDLDPKVLRLEIARALWRSGRDVAGAEAQLRELIKSDPAFVEAAETLGRLLLSRGAWQQADEVLGDAGLLDPGADQNSVELSSLAPASGLGNDADEPALVVERARARLEGEAGDVAAYSVLQATALEQLPPPGLTLRAELAKKVGHDSDVAAVLQEANRRLAREADASPLSAMDKDAYLALAELEGPQGKGPLSWLERIAQRGPLDQATATHLAQLYDDLPDVAAWTASSGKLLELLQAPVLLPPLLRGSLWMKLAQVAIEQGDAAASEDRFARALAEPVTGALRAQWLVQRAQFAVAQKDPESALSDLGEALAADSNHAGALAALGELSYSLRDWAEARRAYEALATKADAEAVIEPVLLAYRQAELAEMFGDEAFAEASYNKVLQLDPGHRGAREALSQFAYMREDHAAVVGLLEPLLEHPAAESAGRRAALSERMGACLLALGKPHEARAHLQHAVRLEPTLLSALQRLTLAQELLGDHAAAATLWNRLSRVFSEPRERAHALYREGELLRASLNNPVAAIDAYLRSADMDPTFAPALVRLVPYYWDRGDILEAAGVAADLHSSEAGRSAAAEENLGLLLCLASAAAGDETLAAKVSPTQWPSDEDVASGLIALASHAPDAVAGASRVQAAWAHCTKVFSEAHVQAVRTAVAQAAADSGDAPNGSPALVAKLVGAPDR